FGHSSAAWFGRRPDHLASSGPCSVPPLPASRGRPTPLSVRAAGILWVPSFPALRSRPGDGECGQNSPFHRLLAVVLVVHGIHLNVVSDADKQWHLDGQAASELRILLDVVAVYSGGRLGGFDEPLRKTPPA